MRWGELIMTIWKELQQITRRNHPVGEHQMI